MKAAETAMPQGKPVDYYKKATTDVSFMFAKVITANFFVARLFCLTSCYSLHFLPIVFSRLVVSDHIFHFPFIFCLLRSFRTFTLRHSLVFSLRRLFFSSVPLSAIFSLSKDLLGVYSSSLACRLVIILSCLEAVRPEPGTLL